MEDARLILGLRRSGIRDERVLAAMTLLSRADFVPERLRDIAVARRGAAHRRGADHQPAVRGGADERGARAPPGRPGAGDRHRLRLPGGGPPPARGGRLQHRGARGSGPHAPPSTSSPSPGRGFISGWGTASPAGRRRRPSTPSCSPRRRSDAARRWWSSSRRADGWWVPIGGQHEGQELVRLRKREEGSCETERLISVRFVPMTPAPAGRALRRDAPMRPCPVCEAPVTGWTCEVCGKQVGSPRPAAASLTLPLEGLEPTQLPPDGLGAASSSPPRTSSPPLPARCPEVPGEPLPGWEATESAGGPDVRRGGLPDVDLGRATPEGPPMAVPAVATCRYCRNVQASGLFCDRCGMRLPWAAPAAASAPVELRPSAGLQALRRAQPAVDGAVWRLWRAAGNRPSHPGAACRRVRPRLQTEPSTELSPELARARLPELQAQLGGPPEHDPLRPDRGGAGGLGDLHRGGGEALLGLDPVSGARGRCRSCSRPGWSSTRGSSTGAGSGTTAGSCELFASLQAVHRALHLDDPARAAAAMSARRAVASSSWRASTARAPRRRSRGWPPRSVRRARGGGHARALGGPDRGRCSARR